MRSTPNAMKISVLLPYNAIDESLLCCSLVGLSSHSPPSRENHLTATRKGSKKSPRPSLRNGDFSRRIMKRSSHGNQLLDLAMVTRAVARESNAETRCVGPIILRESSILARDTLREKVAVWTMARNPI
nr:hypothetical protein CFP56_60249 [Quercus suber]